MLLVFCSELFLKTMRAFCPNINLIMLCAIARTFVTSTMRRAIWSKIKELLALTVFGTACM